MDISKMKLEGDTLVESVTVVKRDMEGNVLGEEVRTKAYSRGDIEQGIDRCTQYMAQIPLEKGHNWEHNLKAVEDEKVKWEAMLEMLPREE